MYFFWEIVELTRKLILVGVASLELVRPGSVTQLYMALIASVFFLVLQVTHVSFPPRVLCLPHPACSRAGQSAHPPFTTTAFSCPVPLLPCVFLWPRSRRWARSRTDARRITRSPQSSAFLSS